MTRPRAIALALALCLATPTSARADEVTLQAGKDNTLYESTTGALSNGAGDFMFTGRTMMGEVRRCVIAFPVEAGIPAGSTINTVTLNLRMSKTQVGATDYGIHRLVDDWGEGDSHAPMEEGGGAPSASGDATWVHRFFSTDVWAAAGGDFDSTASAVVSIGAVGNYSFSTSQMAADVQSWVDGTQGNYGWLIKHTDESFIFTTKRFDTKENDTPANRPTLVVDFTPVAIGTNYCGPAVANSSGLPARILAFGSTSVAVNSVFLRAVDLPTGQFGYFLNSMTQASIPMPGGSQGVLCVGGGIGRYNTLIGNTGMAGELQIMLDLANTPTPAGLVGVNAGETWNFTCWFRDLNPMPTSNFTDGVEVLFQ